MTALRSIKARADYHEILDAPGVPAAELAVNLAHLRLMNRWLGWSRGVWREVRSLLPRQQATVLLLDVATGSGDVPRAVTHWAAREGIGVRAIGSDVSAVVLANARARGDDLALVRHSATALPFRDQSVDVGTLCLAAHHLDPDDLTSALAELWRVSRRGVVVSDLERSTFGYLAARLMALVLRNRLTSHDGPVSVLRAYAPAELRALARRAGLRRIRVRRRFPVRMVLVARRERRP